VNKNYLFVDIGFKFIFFFSDLIFLAAILWINIGMFLDILK